MQACSGPDLFGRIVGVAAGPGNSFAVATAEDPFVRIWNRDTAAVTQFGTPGQGPGEMRSPVGLVLRSNSIEVAGSALRKRVDSYGLDGKHTGDTTLTLSRSGTLDQLMGSPSGEWAYLKEGVNAGGSVWRLNVRSGAVEAIPHPPSLTEGSTASPNVTATGVAAAISNEGVVALGNGEFGYRLALIVPGRAPILRGARPSQGRAACPHQGGSGTAAT